MTVLYTLRHRHWHWLMLAMVGLACVVGVAVYGSRPPAPLTPEQLCREQLGLRRQTADSGAGTAMLFTCINNVTHSRRSPPSTPGR